jgi:hypothetical protein
MDEKPHFNKALESPVHLFNSKSNFLQPFNNESKENTFHSGRVVPTNEHRSPDINRPQPPFLCQQQESFLISVDEVVIEGFDFTFSNYRWSRTSMPYHIHLLLLPKNIIELDGQTIMGQMYTAIIEGFDLTDDIVEVEFEHALHSPQHQHCVSITYDNEWRCQIRFNDTAPQVQREAQFWSQLYATELPIGERDWIASCRRRLDITTDPDPQSDYFDDFISLIDHLRLTFSPCYIFDRNQNEFI